jgi:drug/metabolite transporter (DMT)-like permease
MTPILFAWIASFSYGIYAITAKLIGKYQLKNSYQFSFFITLFSGIIMATISYFYGGRWPSNWTYILLAALFLAVGNALYLRALKVLDVSVFSPLFNIRVAITVILGAVLLGENFSTNTLSLIITIFIAGFFATMDERFSVRSFFTKNIGLGILFMLVLSIQSILVNRAVDQTEYWTATLWMSLSAILASFLILYPKFKSDLSRTKPKEYIGVGLLAVIGSVGDLAAYRAFAGNVSVSSVIISLPLSMVLAFILSIWKPALLEKHSYKVYLVRFAAAAIMIWAALQLK